MDTDLALVIGLVLGAFAIPAAVSALSDKRAPRLAAVAIVIAGAFVVYAIQRHPGGYKLNDVPRAFTRVMGRYIN